MKFIKTYYKLLIWINIIGVLCFTPGDEFKTVKINIPHFDKVVHLGMFYILGLLVQSINFDNIFIKLRVLGLAFIYAGLIEVIQAYFVYMRNGDIIDFLFDSLGLVVGLFTLKFYPRFIKIILK